jgi:hypothetical protein
MEKSIVGGPVLWPGLVYSPLNNAGLIFAVGAIANAAGLLFEEFSPDTNTAVCRRKTGAGWERLKVAFSLRSSSYSRQMNDIDLLVCWLDDTPGFTGPPCLELSKHLERNLDESHSRGARGLESILPETAVDDLTGRARNRESYEETIRQLDDQIKKLQSG